MKFGTKCNTLYNFVRIKVYKKLNDLTILRT